MVESPQRPTPEVEQPASKSYDWLRAEAVAPYRGLRRFIYLAFAASGAIGGFIFLTQLLAGRAESDTLGNLALQGGVVALMLWLLRIDRHRQIRKP